MFRRNPYKKRNPIRTFLSVIVILAIGFTAGVLSEPLLPESVKDNYLEVQNFILDLGNSDEVPTYTHRNLFDRQSATCKPDYLAANLEEEMAVFLGDVQYDLTLSVTVRNIGAEPTKKETVLAEFITNNADDIIRKRATIPSLPVGGSYDIVVSGPKVYRPEQDANKVRIPIVGCRLTTSAGVMAANLSSGGLFNQETRTVEVVK